MKIALAQLPAAGTSTGQRNVVGFDATGALLKKGSTTEFMGKKYGDWQFRRAFF